jgi:hypothetical protein
MEFTKNGISIIINKDRNEPDNIFYDRFWYIISQNVCDYKDLDELIKLSKIWTNIKYYKCRYPKMIASKALQLSKNICVSE